MGEECVREELLYKRCYANIHCKNEAKRVYYDRIQKNDVVNGPSCSNVLAVFAFPENEMLIPEEIVSSPRKRKEVKDICRPVVHDLANCLNKQRKQNGLI